MGSPGLDDSVTTTDTVRLERPARAHPEPPPVPADDPTIVMPVWRPPLPAATVEGELPEPHPAGET